MFAPVTGFVTFVLFGRQLSGNDLLEEYLQSVRRLLALQALFLLRRRLPLARKLLREFRFLGLFLLLPSPLGGQGKQEGSQGAPGVFVCGGLPPLLLDLGRAGGVEVPLGFRLGCSPAIPSPSGADEVGVARSL